jgi:hypothetical protein
MHVKRTMLDRALLAQALEAVASDLFMQHTQELDAIYALWQQIAHDSTLVYRVRGQAPWAVPWWSGTLGQTIPINRFAADYCAGGIDGSQIYPDRHEGSACFLINIGSVVIQYGASPVVQMRSQPFVFAGHKTGSEYATTADRVDCLRQAYELAASAQLGSMRSVQPTSMLFDGSLLFWHVVHQEPGLKARTMADYAAYLEQLPNLYETVAWYTSLPKSKDIVSILRVVVAQEPSLHHLESHIASMHDTQLLAWSLAPGTRTTVFTITHELSDLYPTTMKPHFFYMHTGVEIVRIEIPAYVALDEHKVNLLAALLADQVDKGRGYPVLLAEAHEQAVVKGPDRDFFYHLLTKMIVAHAFERVVSQKSMKKRLLSV